MTWIDFFRLLNQRINNSSSLKEFSWNEPMFVYDLNSKKEYPISIVEVLGEESITITIDTKGVSNNE